ncbi:hypothetical protein ACHWQZ_G004040 [Mnemiopsis leidyi]
MFSSTSESLFGGVSEESRSLFAGSECNELRAAKPAHRYGAVNSVDTKWLTSPEKCLQHKITPTDTLQGISVKYSVPIELIKTVNKLWYQDQLFLRDMLLIPVENVAKRQRNGHVTPSKNHVTSENHVTHPIPGNDRSGSLSAATIDTTPTASNPPISCASPDEDKQLDSLFSRFDHVMRATRESTTKLRSNSNLDFSPQLANVTNLTSV